MEFKISLKKLNELQNKINILDKNVLVSTQNGFKKIKAIGVTSPQSDKIIIKTVDFELSGSPSHRVKYLNEWFFLKDLKIGDYVNTINGIQTIISISNDNNKEDLWDIEVDGGEYFSNGILSHNSSLISAFDFSLYGKSRGRNKKTTTQSALPNRINRTDLVTNIKFVSNSTDIEITRGLAPNILKLSENGIENERAGKANIDDKIEKYIGLDIETFRSFISMSINDFKNFLSLSTDEKQLLLDKLFNLEVINTLNSILKDINKNNKSRLLLLNTEINTLEDSIDSIKKSIERALEREKEDIQQEIDVITADMNSKKDDYKLLKEKVEKIKDKETILSDEMEIERKQLSSTQNDIRNVAKEISLYDSGKCPTCSTDFLSEHFVNLRNTLVQKKTSHEKILEEIQNNILAIRNRQAKLKELGETATKSFNDLNYLLKNYKTQIEKLTLKRKASINESSVNTLEFSNTIEELEVKKSNNQDNVTISKEKELYYKELNRVLSEDGAKKSIIAGIIKPINHFISDNIKKIGLPFEVKLDETFSAEVKSLGVPVDHDTLSTGENKVINVCILVAYLRLIRTKTSVNVLFLDEVFSSIDVDNISHILTLLKSFSQEYNINIFVVHHAILNEEMFDRIIKIDKNVFSTIEEIEM